MRSCLSVAARSAPARTGVRALILGATALTVANCTSNTAVLSGKHPSELKYGVVSSPRVIPEGQPIPKGGGREMVGQPYVVAGRTYVPQEGRGYRREGWASWYGTAFHGRLTANGEVFDRESVAAAHPTLPLPSYVRVTNIVNGKSMVVRVNDRGPYEAGRLIDLSERAAEALEFRRKGTTRVEVRYLGRAPLAGSDDAKLLATLQAHPKDAPSRTLLASLGVRVGEPAMPEPVAALRENRVEIAKLDRPVELGPKRAAARTPAAIDDDEAITPSKSPVRLAALKTPEPPRREAPGGQAEADRAKSILPKVPAGKTAAAARALVAEERSLDRRATRVADATPPRPPRDLRLRMRPVRDDDDD